MRARGCSSWLMVSSHDKCGYTEDLAAVPMARLNWLEWASSLSCRARVSMSPISAEKPFLPSTMVRGTRPTRVVTTGVSQAMASRTVTGPPSIREVTR